MKILGIETSCDETAVAVVESGTKILSNVIASSLSLQQKYGGVVPEIAAREQVKYIISVLEKALKTAKIKNPKKEIKQIAVTIGPGLIGSLLVGVETAKALALLWDKPIIPVNHVYAHIYANFVSKLKMENEKLKIKTKNTIPTTENRQLKTAFPSISLIASGGHTELFLMKDEKSLKWLGGTLDDAAGEAFDKIAKMLGLPYPGGPALERVAKTHNLQLTTYNLKFPRPMINSNDLNFSFSGLKTAVVRELQNNNWKSLKKNTVKTKQFIAQVAHEAQEAIVDVLIAKTTKAAQIYKARSILLSGGVAANSRLREKFNYELRTMNYELIAPSVQLCTDNAAMIASCAYFHNKPLDWRKITVNPSLNIEI